MPNPKEVFESPLKHWSFISTASDDDFEGQCFDRKEAGRLNNSSQLSSSDLRSIRKQINECISAFTNANREGGLLVVGVSSKGEVKGIDHLTETQLNSITDFNSQLRNQTATTKIIAQANSENQSCKILLIYVPYSEYGICETLADPPKAWIRSGVQNLPINEQMRDQLKRDKKIVEYERSYCCPFDIEEVDPHVLKEFKKVFLAGTTYTWSDERVLFEAGMIQNDNSSYVFNNAGFLFISKNPQRILPWSYIRLLRYESDHFDDNKPGLSTFERTFDGSLPQQIRKIRSFFRESGFFKSYQIRKADGGFKNEPEFPIIAVDEAIVNAVAHRDYGIQLPIECLHYKDAFVVKNPGSIIQRDHTPPNEFSLENVTLNSMPRNSKLIEWLKLMQDEDGAAFVRALSEGTKRMHDEMVRINLPSPTYFLKPTFSQVVLLSNLEERVNLYKESTLATKSTEFINLFSLDIKSDEDKTSQVSFMRDKRKEFMRCFQDKLEAMDWYIDSYKFGKTIAHRKGLSHPIPGNVANFVRLYPSYAFQLREYFNRLYLVIDYTLTVRNILNLRQLQEQMPSIDLFNGRAVANHNGWYSGKIISTELEYSEIYLFQIDSVATVPSDRVIPDLPVHIIKKILSNSGIDFDLSKEIKKSSLSISADASRTRYDKTIATAKLISNEIFPVQFENMEFRLKPSPESIPRNKPNTGIALYSISEPQVEFSRRNESANIRNGITQFGGYDDPRLTIELVPICNHSVKDKMAGLIERLKTGKYKYSGSEKTFFTKLIYNTVITVSDDNQMLPECKRILSEHPNWRGNQKRDRLFLIHTPESNYEIDDEKSPYYLIKRFLFENGIPCQMVDTSTINNPDWKDLNLALNIVAKCGVTPWVLPNSIPDADFFIGLSYTQSRKRGTKKLLGYATIFNEFGRWEFYSGNTETFSFDQRTKYFSELTKSTLKRLSLSDRPSIYFHYSDRFSNEDRDAILGAARSVKPNGTYSFVTINTHHNIRLYDNRPETNGSLSRGSYVITSPTQILLSTTGYNPYRKGLGTPKPLEITIKTYKPNGKLEFNPDLKALANQILSLTKLNLASTDSISGVPITIKYAKDIAYLTDAFLRQSDSFKLHPVMEATPWFI